MLARRRCQQRLCVPLEFWWKIRGELRPKYPGTTVRGGLQTPSTLWWFEQCNVLVCGRAELSAPLVVFYFRLPQGNVVTVPAAPLKSESLPTTKLPNEVKIAPRYGKGLGVVL